MLLYPFLCNKSKSNRVYLFFLKPKWLECVEIVRLILNYILSNTFTLGTIFIQFFYEYHCCILWMTIYNTTMWYCQYKLNIYFRLILIEIYEKNRYILYQIINATLLFFRKFSVNRKNVQIPNFPKSWYVKSLFCT